LRFSLRSREMGRVFSSRGEEVSQMGEEGADDGGGGEAEDVAVLTLRREIRLRGRKVVFNEMIKIVLEFQVKY